MDNLNYLPPAVEEDLNAYAIKYYLQDSNYIIIQF